MAASRLLGAAAASVTEGSLEVKLPTIKWTDGKTQRWGRVREEKRRRKKDQRRKRVRRKTMQVCTKV
jgi:hypothetical protein